MRKVMEVGIGLSYNDYVHNLKKQRCAPFINIQGRKVNPLTVILAKFDKSWQSSLDKKG